MWTVWKEMNKKTFDGIDDVKGFDVFKNRWFRTLSLLLLDHPPPVMGAFRNCFVAMGDL